MGANFDSLIDEVLKLVERQLYSQEKTDARESRLKEE